MANFSKQRGDRFTISAVQLATIAMMCAYLVAYLAAAGGVIALLWVGAYTLWTML